MQTFKFSESEARRNAFMKDLRNVQREEIKKRARSEMVKQLSLQSLSQLIDETKYHINTRALGQLVHYANQHFHNAVAHIGNLIIDGVADIAQLERFTLVPDYHPNWLWLAEVLVQREYCTIGLFQHCIKTIAPNRHEKSVRHALSILYKITASDLHSSFLLREEKVLLAILNATFRRDCASKTAYLLILELISKQATMANRFQEGILREKLVKAIKSGFQSIELIVLKNSCRILKELAQKDVFLNGQLERQIISFVHGPYFDMIGQALLQYLLLFVHSQKEKIVELIDKGLLVELSIWKQKFQSEDRQETGQIIQLCREVKDHTSGLGLLSKGIHQELDRLDLLTYKCTISFQ